MLITVFANLKAKPKPKLGLVGIIFTLKNKINKKNAFVPYLNYPIRDSPRGHENSCTS